MAVKLGDAYIAIDARDELDKGLKAARRKVNGFLDNITTGIAQGIGQALAQGVGNVIRGGIDEIGKSVKAASDLNETLAKVGAVFGENAREIVAWSKTTSTAFGLAQSDALQAAGSLGNMFDQLGFGGAEAADFSKQLIETAGDLTAFHNVAGGTPEVLEAMQSAFRGEFDPLQRYIPMITAAAVQQQAMADTGKKNAEQLTAQEKAAATLAIIMDNLGAANGAAAREIESATSQQRIFNARLEESRTMLGQAFVPIQQAFFRGLNELMTLVAPYGENIIRSFVGGMADAIIYVLPVLAELRQVFVQLLKPGSPPRLLPELTKWGAGAMQAYLEGWTTADFDVLKSVGGMIENVVRSFAASGDIKETDLVSTVFGTQRTITQAIRDFRNLGRVTEATLGSIAGAAGPAGAEIAGLVREYFQLQQATRKVSAAQDELNDITDRYAQALNPLQGQLDAVRGKQQEIRENQRLEELGGILRDPNADVDEKQLARLEAQEIQLDRQMRAIEGERDTAVDAAQAKIEAAEAEEAAQRAKYDTAQAALDQQTRTNALIAEETDLRMRLASEALAAQEKAIRELEAAQREAETAERKRLSELEQIADAQLRYQLATTDTAGQLALMQAELAKVAVGSAEYFDILTSIAQLEKRLQGERDKASGLGGSGTGGLIEAVEGLGETWPEIEKLTDAFDQFFATIAGEDDAATDLTWGQGILDFFTESKRLIDEVTPRFQNLWTVIMGGEIEGTEDGGDPFAGNFWLSGLIPFMDGLILTLDQLLTGDWAGLWGRFKTYVDNVVERTSDGSDPATFGLYTWLADTAIPLLESLAATDWATMWQGFEDAVLGTWQSIVDFIDARIVEITTAIQDFQSLFGFTPDVLGDNPRINPNKVPQPSIPGEDVLPGSPFASFNGINPQVPSFAGAGGSVTGDTVVFQIEQNIATNGDFGGARQGALEGIRQALINRTVQGTI